MRQQPAVPPRPLFRWQLGLLWASRPRSLIPCGLADFAASGTHQPLSNPRGNADPRQAGRLADQLLLLGEQANTDGGGLGAVGLWSRHAVSVGQVTPQVKGSNPKFPY